MILTSHCRLCVVLYNDLTLFLFTCTLSTKSYSSNLNRNKTRYRKNMSSNNTLTSKEV